LQEPTEQDTTVQDPQRTQPEPEQQTLPELPVDEASAPAAAPEDSQLKAILEAIVYITDEPLAAQQMAAALQQPLDKIKRLLDELVEEYAKPEHGLSIREVAGGYKMATKAEHHEAVRAFVKKLTPPLKLSLAALETLAVIAYKQPVTAPEIMDIRGVQGAGVLKTLLDRKLIAEGGRKAVVGKPILYKTTKEFLVQFGLNSLNELPTLKEFEELGRLELVDDALVEGPASVEQAAAETAASPETATSEAVVSEASPSEDSEPAPPPENG
jgi:segregation and condensation protein B